MKRKIDVFWYWFLIIVAFVICFMFSSTRASAAVSGEVVVDPGNGSGDITVNPPISGEELYEQCHTYITTNIISAESLTEALNGKIYGDFTQEDCMEMINIASKREVIKNLLNIEEKERIIDYSSSYASYFINIPQITLDAGTYTFSFKIKANDKVVFNKVMLCIEYTTLNSTSFYTYLTNEYVLIARQITLAEAITINRLQFQSGDSYGTIYLKEIMLEKGSTATPYVSYDYHREYYQEGMEYADNRVNTNSTSYTQGVTDADNRVNTNSTNYKAGASSGYEKANKEGKLLGNFIPSLLGGFGSFFLTLLNIDILGFNLLSVIGILITVLGIVVVIKFLKG